MQMIARLRGVEPPRMSQLSLLPPQPTPLCLSYVNGEARNGSYLSHL